MYRTGRLAAALMFVLGAGASSVRAAEFPYGISGHVLLQNGARLTNGNLDWSKVLITASPRGFSPKQLSVTIELFARIGAGKTPVAILGCTYTKPAAEVAAGETAMYLGASCNPPPAAVSVPANASLDASMSARFEPRDETMLPQAIASMTQTRTEIVQPYPADFPADCTAPAVAGAGPGATRIRATVYQLPNAVDERTGRVDLSKLCLAATPLGADINNPIAFVTIFAGHNDQEAFVARANCAFGLNTNKIAPVKAGATLTSHLNSCDSQPSFAMVPKGFTLRAAISLSFGARQAVSVSSGPVLEYPAFVVK